MGRQFLRAGLVDDLQIHLAPVLLGEGIRLFEIGSERV
ncbi:dihydrofolate reductase family protein [Nonomuraea aurantiaca]|nr:dihydrofolate reductase family protein [Nonomuraea aurantiaca]